MITQSNGYLDGNGSSPFSAHEDHNHETAYAAINHTHEGMMIAEVREVKTTDWDESACTVSYTGTFVDMIIANGSKSVATTAGVEITSVTDGEGETPGSLVLGCTDTPTDDIILYVVVL